MSSLTELEELRSSATQGDYRVLEEHMKGIRYTFGVVGQNHELFCAGTGTKEDAEYIVALHNAYPSLKARIEELERKAEAGEKLAEAVEGTGDFWDGRCRSCMNKPCDYSCSGCPYPFVDYSDGTGGFERLHTALAAYRSATQDDSKE